MEEIRTLAIRVQDDGKLIEGGGRAWQVETKGGQETDIYVMLLRKSRRREKC